MAVFQCHLGAALSSKGICLVFNTNQLWTPHPIPVLLSLPAQPACLLSGGRAASWGAVLTVPL